MSMTMRSGIAESECANECKKIKKKNWKNKSNFHFDFIFKAFNSGGRIAELKEQ